MDTLRLPTRVRTVLLATILAGSACFGVGMATASAATPKIFIFVNVNPTGGVTNSVQSWQLDSDGSMVFVGTYPTGGISSQGDLDAERVGLAVGPGVLYAIDYGSSDISEFRMEGSDGQLSEVGQVSVPSGSTTIAVSPTDKTLYVGTTNSISWYAISPNGLLGSAPAGSVGGVFTPVNLAVSPDDSWLESASSDAGDGTPDDPPTGQLTTLAVGIGGGLSSPQQLTVNNVAPTDVSFSADSGRVFAAGYGGVGAYQVSGTGSLSQTGYVGSAAANSRTLRTSPDGQWLYVAETKTDDVTRYSVGSGGSLMASSSVSTPGAGNGPITLGVAPTGAQLVTANWNDGSMSSYQTPGDGTMTVGVTVSLPANGEPSVLVYNPTNACTQPGSSCTDIQNIEGSVPVGTLVMSTPYTASNPLDVGDLALNAGGTEWIGTAAFQCITVTDATSGGQPFSASAIATALQLIAGPAPGSNAYTSINPENVGLTNVAARTGTSGSCPDGTTPNDSYTKAVAITDQPAASGVPPMDMGSAGLGGSAPHPLLMGTAGGEGTATYDAQLTLTAPTSTAAGTYAGTIIFTVTD